MENIKLNVFVRIKSTNWKRTAIKMRGLRIELSSFELSANRKYVSIASGLQS